MGFKIMMLLLKFVDFITLPFYWFKTLKKKKVVPKTDNPLVHLSATQLSRKIRKKEISAYEVIQFYINRIKEVNPIINAIVDDRFSQALEDAKKADDFLQNTKLSEAELEKSKPLLGVPVTIKESCSLTGCSLTCGTLTRVGIKATEDGEAVARLKAAGAIPLAVTNIPEFCMALETDNLVVGATHNPYDTNRTSGGSSGGEAAIISAGASIAGIGSDLAGSVRVPASFCGIFGYKPTPTFVPLKGHFPLPVDPLIHQSLTIGPLTRYAEDLKLIANVMGGKEIQKLNLNEKVDLSSLKLYYMYDFEKETQMPKVLPEIKKAIEKCAEYLKENCKARLIKYNYDDLRESPEMCAAHMLRIGLEGCPNLLEDPKDPKIERNVYIETIKSLLGQSNVSLAALTFYIMHKTQLNMTEKEREEYLSKIEYLRRKLKIALTDGVLLYPTYWSTALLPRQFLLKITGVGYPTIYSAIGFPAVNVPVGLSKKGLPIGISVISAPNNDRYCLAVAEELEKKFGGWTPPY